ncbi:MAG: DNA repair protein RecO [Bacteroidia bacterium]
MEWRQALLLRRYPYGEKNLIVHLYSPGKGRWEAMVVGSKQAHVPYQMGAFLRVIVYERPTRSVQKITQSEYLYLYRQLWQMPGVWVLQFWLQWLEPCLHAPDPSLFAYIFQGLQHLDALEPTNFGAYTYGFFTDFLIFLGYGTSKAKTLAELMDLYARHVPSWHRPALWELSGFRQCLLKAGAP